ncbi:PknH-like extracellular domain-containing protein [Cellulomonas marina]|uniref:PknH-like extracellular domain-containing protein n=1 Tax=Cellulomonas marina TaxID=988821 RepID=A0A1I0ZJ59_9CELL|nr:PknH-like extracellular domain-containing protein [Cellulomonas marina]
MRTTRTSRARTATACAGVLAVLTAGGVTACTSDGSSAAPATSASPTGQLASVTASATPSEAPATPDASLAPTPVVAPTDVPDEVLLPPAALDGQGLPRQLVEVVVPWRLPPGCGAGQPDTAVAMRGQELGTGEFEAVVPVQQVAVFPDAAAAVVELDRVRGRLAGCAPEEPDATTVYVREDVAVGAQGTGLATSYNGGTDDGALGTYAVLTRRGNAVVLVGGEGGERNLGDARAQETAHAQAAWELLARYELDAG